MGTEKGLAGLAVVVLSLAVSALAPAIAGATVFSTGTPTNAMGVASRPGVGGVQEIEAADDFPLTSGATVGRFTFTGLVPTGSLVQQVRVEIYRVFPQDSNATRMPAVPTRTNSPSDVDFASADSATAGQLTFTTTTLSPSFTALNTVINGIHPFPNQHTGGEGPATGAETTFTVSLPHPFSLPAGHYFFVPQVRVDAGNFLWLSAAKPILAPGTPFPTGVTDLQSWIRNAALAPDWLRVGTDIVGGATPPTFNAAFSLVACSPITAAPASLPTAFAGTPYGIPLTVSGGTAPYTVSATGSLPPGMALRSDGTLIGTPTQTGSFPIHLKIDDSGMCETTQLLTFNVASIPTPLPAPTAPPAVSGHVVVGSALGCLPGSWTGNPSFGVTWLRDGRGIGTAHGLSYTPTLADAGHAIQCEVTATNANGSAIAASPAVLVPIPRPPRPALGGAPVKLAHGRAPVLAGCIGVPGQRCTATLRLTVTSGTGRHRRTTTVGSTRATVAVSQRLVTVRVPLTSAGMRLVNAAKHHRLTVTASFGSASRALTLQG